ncbi:MAG TPA: alpha/beta fold hydrolase [Dermatophilaceae bacterium]|nr:alpha/beta fold hydrolase [Dermatophilaceae bacterium]
MLRHAALGAAAVGAGTAAAAGTGSVAAAAWFARRVLTPEHAKPDDVLVREVGERTVVLDATAETVAPGRYGLWLDGGAGHVRLGDPVGAVPPAGRGTVEREVLAVDRGALRPGPGRWNQYFYGTPPQHSLGLASEDVLVEGELGPMPAWCVPPSAHGGSGAPAGAGGAGAGGAGAGTAGAATPGRWAVLVHGRGATREETLRAVPTLHRLGWTSLVITYRNDAGVPSGPDGRYNLGLSEWRDVEAAIRFAVRAGAREVALTGWSMGGAIVLQALDRSELADRVTRVVLDAPVLDWADVLRHQAGTNRLPPTVAALGTTMMGSRWARRLVGVHHPVDVARTDWVRRAGELRHPMLLIHSADDEFVPVGASRAVARARPDLVRFEEWQVARHTKEWNTDPERWERAVAAFLTG